MIAILVLAVIQGVAEFLPISSSAHLVIFRDLFGVGKNLITNDISFIFDISLHLGTTLAVLIYFYKDFRNMFESVIKLRIKDNSLLQLIIVATIPTAIVGFLLDDIIEEQLRDKYFIIAIVLIVMGIVIYFIDKLKCEKKCINQLTIMDSLIIGCMQIFALFPGVSRSGATIAASRFLNINREDAAKFSFYLSLPVVLGATILQIVKIDTSIIINNITIFIVGILVSFLTGIVSIKCLLKYLKNNNFKIFMWYRIVFGLLVLLYIFMK